MGRNEGKEEGKERGRGEKRKEKRGEKKTGQGRGFQGACPLAGVKGTGPLSSLQDLSPTRHQLGTFSKPNRQKWPRGTWGHGEPPPHSPPSPHPPTPLPPNSKHPTLTGSPHVGWHLIAHVSTWDESPCSMEHATPFPAQNNPICTWVCPPTFLHLTILQKTEKISKICTWAW